MCSTINFLGGRAHVFNEGNHTFQTQWGLHCPFCPLTKKSQKKTRKRENKARGKKWQILEKYKKTEIFKRDIEKIFIIYLFIQGIKETMGKVKSNKRDKEFFKSTIQLAIIVIGISLRVPAIAFIFHYEINLQTYSSQARTNCGSHSILHRQYNL